MTRKNELAKTQDALPEVPLDPAMLEQVLVGGDLSRLTPQQRLSYYRMRCDAAGIDARAKPFEYVMLNGKLVLYAGKACVNQLCGAHGISTTITHEGQVGDIYRVVAKASKSPGQASEDIGAVSVKGLTGDPLCNAMMKAVTKAKRRAVLALCGLGELDESELETVPGAKVVDIVDAAPAATVPLPAAKPKLSPVRKPEPEPEPTPAPEAPATDMTPEQSDGRYSFLANEVQEWLQGVWSWGKKSLTDGRPMKGVMRYEVMEDVLGRQFLGWARENADKGKPLQDEAEQLLAIWHRIEEQAQPPTLKGSISPPRGKAPDVRSFDPEEASRFARAKITNEESPHRGRTMYEVVEIDREYVERHYVDEGYGCAALVLGMDMRAAGRYESAEDRQGFLDTCNKVRMRAAGSEAEPPPVIKPPRKKLHLGQKLPNYMDDSWFIQECDRLAKKNDSTLDELRAGVREEWDGKDLESLNLNERKQLAADLES